MSLPDFINILKSKKSIYRVPFGKENQGFDIQQFNTLMQSEKHNGNDAHGGGEPRHLAYQRISIKEDENGHLGLFESDKSG